MNSDSTLSACLTSSSGRETLEIVFRGREGGGAAVGALSISTREFFDIEEGDDIHFSAAYLVFALDDLSLFEESLRSWLETQELFSFEMRAGHRRLLNFALRCDESFIITPGKAYADVLFESGYRTFRVRFVVDPSCIQQFLDSLVSVRNSLF